MVFETVGVEIGLGVYVQVKKSLRKEIQQTLVHPGV